MGRTVEERWGALMMRRKSAEEFKGKTDIDKIPLMTGAQLALQSSTAFIKSKGEMPVRAAARDGEKTVGHGRRPLAHKGDWEKRLAKVSKQLQFRH